MSKLPTLYHKAKGGDLRQWRVWSDGPIIYTEYGQVGGVLQTSNKIAEPKNVGRSNATSPEEQAKLEAKSLWTHKVERKYSETPAGAQEDLYLPMLAHTYKDKTDYPCDMQPKLDGVRCLATRDITGKIMLTSRQGKEWNIPHIAKQLDSWMPRDMTLDGEIYIHGESCQRITSLAKSTDPTSKSFKKESEKLEYYIYDVPVLLGSDTHPWEHRRRFMEKNVAPNARTVETLTVQSKQDMIERYGVFVQWGYEGAILRAHHGLYLWGYRSRELLKVKEFQDAEFKVLDARDGKGKMEGCVVWICRNNLNDKTFECTMKVPMDERRRMYTERKSFMGKLLTVRYFDLTDDKLPRFPVGIVFRDEKDLPS